MAKKQYPPFPPHIAEAWHYMELMLRGAQDPEFTVEFFDRINEQVLFIHNKKARKDPVIQAMLIAAVEALEEKARKKRQRRDSP